MILNRLLTLMTVFYFLLLSIYSNAQEETFVRPMMKLNVAAEFSTSLDSDRTFDWESSWITRIARKFSTADHFRTVSQNIEGPMSVVGDAVQNQTVTEYLINETCANDAAVVVKGILEKQLWALTMVDASGKPPSNILLGNFQWLGSRTQCASVHAEFVNHTTRHPGAHYCYAKIANLTSLQSITPFVMTIGLCLPESCSNNDLALSVTEVLRKLSIPKEIGVFDSQCLTSSRRQVDGSEIAVITLVSVLFTVIVIATCYDVIALELHLVSPCIMNGSRPRRAPSVQDEPIVDGILSDSVQIDEHTPLLRQPKETTQEMSLFYRLLLAFSAYKNGGKLLRVDESKSGVLCALHGIRFLSMSWVILGHTYVFASASVSNVLSIFDIAKRFSFQAIANATVSVDSFFLLSGTLVSYLLLKELVQCQGFRKVKWWKFYFHRFWRLTPIYMILLAVFTVLYPHWGSGPLFNTNIVGDCRKNWWLNLLYVNNLFDMNHQCMGWAWYLANDMQFFIVSPIFIVLLYKSAVVGTISVVLGITGIVVATGVLTAIHNYPAEIPDALTRPNDLSDQFNVVYAKPWCRAAPYLVGILLGYILHRVNGRYKLHPFLAVVGWLIAAVINLSVLYGLYGAANGHELSQAVTSFYAAVHRMAWAVGLAWVIFACVTGNGGFVNKILSWPALIPLSRMTYAAYLVHPIVLSYFYGTLEMPIYAQDIIMVL